MEVMHTMATAFQEAMEAVATHACEAGVADVVVRSMANNTMMIMMMVMMMTTMTLVMVVMMVMMVMMMTTMTLVMVVMMMVVMMVVMMMMMMTAMTLVMMMVTMMIRLANYHLIFEIRSIIHDNLNLIENKCKNIIITMLVYY